MRLTSRCLTAVTGAVLATAAAAVGPATSAHASDECGPRTTTQAFAAFGDTNQYFPVRGGTFETGDLSPFAVTGGPRVVGENEPWRVLGAHSRSVALPPGATLRAGFCVQIGEDSLRAFAKAPGGSGASLKVKATVSTVNGSSTSSQSISGTTGSWAPTPRLALTNVAGPDGRQYVTVTFTNAGTGTWLVDDILVDPWKTK